VSLLHRFNLTLNEILKREHNFSLLDEIV